MSSCAALVRSLLTLRKERRSGVLHVTTDDVRTFVYLDQGTPVFAEEGTHGETLGRSAEKLLKALRTRSAEVPSLFSLVSFRVQQSIWRRMAAGTLDQRYWEGKGWLEKDCKYYMPCRAGFLRRGTAWLLSRAAIAIFN